MQLDLFEALRHDLQAITPIAEQSITLRPYQDESVSGVFREWESHCSTLVCLPTGTGKSVVFSAVIDEVLRRQPHQRVLVLAHRDELILQAVQHAKNVGRTAGIEMGQSRARHEQVVVSTVQTQTAFSKCRDCRGEGCDFCGGQGKRRRFLRFDPKRFSTLIIDEAHHATANTYRLCMEHYTQNPELKILLVTATPKRTDNVGLHNVCDSVAYEMDLRTAIKDGWLVPIRQQFVVVDHLNLSEVGTKAGGDLADGDLQRAFLDGDEDEMLHAIAYPTIQAAKGRRTLVFAAGKEHAEKLTAAFNSYDNVTAEFVTDDTDRKERRAIIQRYRDGTTQVLVNCMVFTEGFDVPDAAVLANARPTKSTSLYQQMIGRVTRPIKGVVDGIDTAEGRKKAIAESDKDHCLVLDFTGVAGQHKLVSTADILSGDDVQPIDYEAALKYAQEIGEPVDMEEVIEKVKAGREAKEREEAERKRLATKRRAESGDYHTTDVDPFGGFDPFTDYEPSGPRMATQKQVNLLMKLGVQPGVAINYTKRQAGAVIDSYMQRTGGDYVLTFGKHAGKPLKAVPRGYLFWAKDNIQRPDFQRNLRTFLESKQPVTT